MKHEQWLKNSTRCVAMTGYTPERFMALLPYFQQAHDEYLAKYQMNGKRRKGLRSFVLYTSSPLPCVKERLAFILSYLKLNPIQEQHADLFCMEQKQCNEFVHGLSIILDNALKLAGTMPAQSNAELQKILAQIQANPSADKANKNLLHDGTEREIPRPVDTQRQQDYYSGKKKKHTVKNALLITALCFILFVSPTVQGKMHDKKIADTYYSIPKGFKLGQDTGLQGYHPKGVTIIQPVKKPKGKELTKKQKQSNRRISSYRVRIEHAIGSVKRYRIVKDECRLRKNNFVEKIIVSCAALHNFRLIKQPFRYKNKLT